VGKKKKECWGNETNGGEIIDKGTWILNVWEPDRVLATGGLWWNRGTANPQEGGFVGTSFYEKK